MPTAKSSKDGMVSPAAVVVWRALKEHGEASATKLHALRKAPGRAAATSDRLVELLNVEPPCVEVVGVDTSGRGLHARIYKATREPTVRPPKGAALEAKIVDLLTAAGGTLEFSALRSSTKAKREVLMAACTRLYKAGKLTKTAGSRPSYSLVAEARVRKAPRVADRKPEWHTVIAPSGRRLTTRERYDEDAEA